MRVRLGDSSEPSGIRLFVLGDPWRALLSLTSARRTRKVRFRNGFFLHESYTAKIMPNYVMNSIIYDWFFSPQAGRGGFACSLNTSSRCGG
jgi:hypothetical protein